LKKITIGMAVVALALAALAYAGGGAGRVVEALEVGGVMLARVSLLLLLAFSTAGLVSVLVSEEQVRRWLGKEAGWRGVLLGGLAGALMPGGPYAYYPLAATFLVSGAEIGSVMSFVIAKNLWTLSRVPLELALLGPRITFIRYVVTLAFPFLLGVMTNVLFSRTTEKVRESIHRLRYPQEVKTGRGPAE
jgi:uncharacterized membrane protein YraQ (UPF0718 family)